jgi:SAM-dependent methyltransferase
MSDADLPRAYFDDRYDVSDDPWLLENRFYERRKRELLLACLPRARFARAFEPGCAGGALTVGLAQRCDEVLAWDIARRAVTLAGTRVPVNVSVVQRAFPAQRPAGRFDLIVISEMGYYCAEPAKLSDAVSGLLAPAAVLVACHWRHPARGYPQTAEAVHAALAVGRPHLAHHVEEDFLLDVWSVDGESVARAEGILD